MDYLMSIYLSVSFLPRVTGFVFFSSRGVIGSSGGSLMVHKLQGRNNYLASYSHGVHSQPLTKWTASFSVTSRGKHFTSYLCTLPASTPSEQ